METPPELRTGWVFEPDSLGRRLGRKPNVERPDQEWVGKVISRIGKKANIVVDEGKERTGSRLKYASAHDLRRTFCQRLADSNLEKDLAIKLMRHADIKTMEQWYQVANTQRDAKAIRAKLTAKCGQFGHKNRTQFLGASS